jgi:hypothetical protein
VGIRGLAQVGGRQVPGGAAADDFGAFLGEKEVHHLLILRFFARRADDEVYGVAPAHAQHRHGAVVAGLAAVEAVAFVGDEPAVVLAEFCGR